MTPEQWLQMQQVFAEVRDMNAVTIVIRRGANTLAEQTVRVESVGNQARAGRSQGAEQAATAIIVLGATDLDIQAKDRFTVAGQLYEVQLVHPNRRAATMAEANVVE